jgi:hypothetical protein
VDKQKNNWVTKELQCHCELIYNKVFSIFIFNLDEKYDFYTVAEQIELNL